MGILPVSSPPGQKDPPRKKEEKGKRKNLFRAPSGQLSRLDGKKGKDSVDVFAIRPQKAEYKASHTMTAGEAKEQAGAINGIVPRTRPKCGSKEMRRDGVRTGGIRRYRCGECGKRFVPTAGTLLDGHRLPLKTIAKFVRDILSRFSPYAACIDCGISMTTGKFLLWKMLEVLDGICQNKMLSGLVLADETYVKKRRSDPETKPDGQLYRGLSRNLICIGTVCALRHTIMEALGEAKPDESEMTGFPKRRMDLESTLVHDRERLRLEFAETLFEKDVGFKADDLKALPDGKDPIGEWTTSAACTKSF